jgi:RsmE family RNA methyltransferase
MNILLFEASELAADGCVEVGGRRLRHLRDVLDAQPGDRLRAGLIDGELGAARVLGIDEQRAVLQVELDSPAPEKLPLTLVVALPRPKMLRRILRSVAEFGVAELHLVNSYRVEKSYWQTPVMQADTIRHYLLQGLEQSVDTVLPRVHCHRRFKPWVEDALPTLLDGRPGLLAHPGEHPPCPRELSAHTLLVIGPEGGFIPYEVDKLCAAGCEKVSLGPRILRVENAVATVLGRFV